MLIYRKNYKNKVWYQSLFWNGRKTTAKKGTSIKTSPSLLVASGSAMTAGNGDEQANSSDTSIVTTLTTLATNSPVSKPSTPRLALSDASKSARISRQKQINLDDERQSQSSLDKIKSMVFVRTVTRLDLFASKNHQQQQTNSQTLLSNNNRPLVSILSSNRKNGQVITVPSVNSMPNDVNKQSISNISSSSSITSTSTTTTRPTFITPISIAVSENNQPQTGTIQKQSQQVTPPFQKSGSKLGSVSDAEPPNPNNLTTPVTNDSLSRKSSCNSVRYTLFF